MELQIQPVGHNGGFNEMRLNNRGVIYMWTVILFVGATIGLFKTVIRADEKQNHSKRLAEELKIAPEDKYSKQTLYVR